MIARIVPRWFKRGAYRFVWRLRLWRTMLRELRGERVGGSLMLTASAVADLFTHVLSPDGAGSPRVLRSGVVSAPAIGARFHVRAGTDDLYNVLPRRERDAHDAILSPLRPHAGSEEGFGEDPIRDARPSFRE